MEEGEGLPVTSNNMRKFLCSPEVKQKFLDFDFFGVKISDVAVSEKLQFVKARKKEIVDEFTI